MLGPGVEAGKRVASIASIASIALTTRVRLVWDTLSRRGRPLIGDSKEAFAIAEAIVDLLIGALGRALVGSWLGLVRPCLALSGFLSCLEKDQCVCGPEPSHRDSSYVSPSTRPM